MPSPADPGESPAPTTSPRPADALTLDTRSLRALAHPVRVRMMTLLREDGPSTATRLAERLGLNSGATSYHLRQLAAADLVTEDAERGNARERWWRSAHRATYFDPYDLPETERGASAVYLSALAAEYGERVRQAAHDFLVYPEAWQRSGDMSDFRLLLAPDEAAALIHDLHAVVEGYRGVRAAAEDTPAGAQVVVTQIQVMPQLPPDLLAPTDQRGPTPTSDPEEPQPS